VLAGKPSLEASAGGTTVASDGAGDFAAQPDRFRARTTMEERTVVFRTAGE